MGLSAAVPLRARRRQRRRAIAKALAAAAALVAAAAADDATADTPTATAAAAQDVVVLKRGDRGPAVTRLQRRLGIAADGVFGRQTLRSVKRFQRTQGLEPDGIVGPLTRSALGMRPFGRGSVYRPRARAQARVAVPAILRRIAVCESGGNPSAVSSSGLYRGKYQFTGSTWQSLGGTGDPARAPEWLQDGLALKLYRLRGTAPWPVCGR